MVFKEGCTPWNKGLHQSIVVRKKISEALKGRFSGSNNPMYGKPGTMLGKHFSEETRKKMSAANSGMNNYHYGEPLSEEWKRKIGDALRGRHRPEEVRRKIGEANKGKHRRFGPDNPSYGKYHSIKTREKISQVHKGKYSGSGNPNYIDGRTKDLNWDRGYRGENWNEIRVQVLKRDGYNCQWQQILPSFTISECKGNLAIHHLNNYRNTRDDDPAYMLTLCRRHHQIAEMLYKQKGGDFAAA